jgi:hypothetical protein
MPGPVTLYGVAIQQAMASGDLAKMKQVVAQAKDRLAEHSEIQGALSALQAEIAKVEGGSHAAGPIVLYGETIQKAIASGNLARMKAVHAEGDAHATELNAALAALKAEIAKRQP